MIFTHIFRYLDDRDAAEELRRSDDTNSSRPAINSRFPEASWEQRDFRFKQISLKTTAAPNTSGINTPGNDSLTGGFCSLRAKPRPSPEQRFFQPIRASKISREEKQLRVTHQNLAKLPPIERFGCKQKPVAREVKSRSKENKESILRRGSGVQTQPWLFLCPLRDGEDRELCNRDGRVLTAGTTTDNLSDHFLSDESESPAHTVKAKKHQPVKTSHDKFDAKAVTRKFYNEGLQQRTKQEVFGSGDAHESTQIEAITDRKEGNSTVSRQLNKKKWAARQEQSANTNNEEKKFHPRSSSGERKPFSFSEARSKKDGEVPCSRCKATNAECLHFAESDENLNASLATLTIGKKEINMEFNDCERRNAICEVIEKTAFPEYGLCLYEMRQNLIHLLEDQSSFLGRNTRSNKSSTLWRLCRI